jgi:hypothetical protein
MTDRTEQSSHTVLYCTCLTYSVISTLNVSTRLYSIVVLYEHRTEVASRVCGGPDQRQINEKKKGKKGYLLQQRMPQRACLRAGIFTLLTRNHTYDASQEAGWREQQAWFFADRNQSAMLQAARLCLLCRLALATACASHDHVQYSLATLRPAQT